MKSKGENLHTKGLIPAEIRNDTARKTWECSPESGTVVSQIVDRITVFGGFALLVDYGHDGDRNTHSFRAYKRHKQVNPLENPGNVDLTADVDFGYLKGLVADKAVVFGPTEQRNLLLQLGIEHRLRRLLQVCKNRQQQEDLIKSYNMLLGEMGEKFKALALFPKTLEFILEKRGGPVGFLSTKTTENGDGNTQK
uniref:Protein arginine methyltransferase NDUFAF7 n=1 Tax=Caenorhabditis japonica TaxID=281687 RepID=A0A8R1IWC7_CAEJA